MTRDRKRELRWQRGWDKQASSYDRSMTFFDRHFFGNTRQWICERASGQTLEVAIGTALNLPFYPAEVALTGVDWSEAMLARARHRADQLARSVDLRVGDAHHLDFPDATFDTVLATFGLCAIPDEARAVAEMIRVLRPGGSLLLADHVRSTARPVRAVQRTLELLTMPLAGEHFRRRPLDRVVAAGLDVQEHERFKLGIVERLRATKPAR